MNAAALLAMLGRVEAEAGALPALPDGWRVIEGQRSS